MVTSISTITLYLAYMFPIYLNWRNKRRGQGEFTTPETAPWNLGKWGPVLNVIAIVWVLIISVIFSLPPNELVLWTMVGLGIVLALYWQLSAFHKSLRGSQPDAALYWLARMLDGGGDARHVARRMVAMASEDIGNADPRALQLALNAVEAYDRLGSPEGELALAQAATYLAMAPKSNAAYLAWNQAKEFVRQDGSRPVPIHLRNAPAKLMKEMGYGAAYRYAHDEPNAYAAGQSYFPDGVEPQHWYRPTDRGLDAKTAEKLAWLRSLDESARKADEGS